MALLALKYLRCDVVGSTADGAFALSVELELSGKTEVSDFDLHAVVQEEVAQLEVSVDDAVGVEILDCGADLVEVALDLDLVEALSPAQ